ncbi:hypothetical protein [Streptomyces sp. 4R-3d]|uniref:hypothetical protein n=1 Tax=Streptomyces sp. 4R-3d TaxID=2559605 RepID=UPI00107221F2|nr:hypothetical protein [Streptomyces sp. 4R-3d]TFI24986.1 hypothetical protein E4P36_20795 [Streptomyces sp. 4R-3d]
MTTTHSTDGWPIAVLRGLGRALPLGEAEDATWLFEGAAVTELRRAGAAVPGAAPGGLRIGLADPDAAGILAATAPPGALPRGPLCIDGEFAALPGEPLTALADQLRQVMFACAADRLGLHVTQVNLQVTALLEAADASAVTSAPVEVPTASPDSEAAFTALAVPGVARLTGTLGSPVTERRGHLRIELATAAGHHPLHVARAVRTAITATRPGGDTVTVLIAAANVRA